MKYYLKVLFVVIAYFNISILSGQIEISEIASDGTVEIINSGANTVDVSNYWLCNRPAYTRMSNLTTECGNLSLAAGESVTVSGFNLDAAGDELGVYSNSSFGSSSGLEDYVIWGNRSGGTRETVAVAAGLWTSGQRADAILSSQSLVRDLDRQGASAYAQGESSICEEASSDDNTSCDVDGGTITFLDGSDRASICVDGNPDPLDVVFSTTGSGASSGFIITDNNNNILGVPSGSGPFDLDGAGVGTCLIWAVSYEAGFDGAAVGSNLSNLTGCFDLSEPLTVYREAPDGGMVSLLDGSTSFAQCAGQISFDVMHVNDAQFLSYWYIITDSNDNILGWVNSANSNTVDLSSAPAGTCRVWGWSYRGLGDPIIGDPISTLTDDDCEAISDNFITVYREVPDGGAVTLLDGSTNFAQCAGQVTFDVTHTTTAPNLSYWYIITDDNNDILGWVNSANSNTLDLSGAPAGTCRVWGWNYRGLGDPVVGDPLSTLMDDFCEDISEDFITVYREVPDGGMVSLLDGSTSYTGTAGNIVFDVMHTTTAPFLSYWYIITDDNNDILGWVNSANSNTLDLSGAPAGTCRVWGWNYRGLGDPVVGQPLSTLMDDFCEDISENFITVTRNAGDDNGAGSQQEFTIRLSGLQEPNPALSRAYGTLSATLDGSVLSVSGSFAGLVGDFDASIAGGAHIHKAIAGRNGGVELLLTTDVAADLRSGSYDASANTFTLTDDQLAALNNRELYVNIHTTRFAGGELRGQIVPTSDAFYLANLAGSNEVPAIQTQASGNLIFEVTGRQLTVSGSFDDLEGDIAIALAGGAHIHDAPNGQNGDVVFPLNLTIDDDNRGAIVASSNNTFTLSDDQYNRLRSQGYYINVHSLVNMPGELRGQIKPISAATFRSDLTGVQEVPAVNTDATGRIEVNYDGRGSITVSGSFNGLSSAINEELAGGIHIHTAPAGRNAGVTFVLTPDLSSDLTSGIIRPEANTFSVTDEQVADLYARQMYINVHSLTNVPGEIRGQLQPLAKNYLGTSLDGINEIQPIATTGGGHMLFEITDNRLYVTGGFENLIGDFDVSIAGGSHVHTSDARGNGGIALLLDAALDADLRGGSYAPMANGFDISDSLRDSLINGYLYVNLHSTVFPSGELRGQILNANNRFPSADFGITSPQGGAQVNVDASQSGDFTVTWSPTQDIDGDIVVYTWQLASDDAFDNLLFQYKVGDELTFAASYATIDSILADAGIAMGASTSLYHRVLASDGSVSTASPSSIVGVVRGADTGCNVDAGVITFANGETRASICVDGNPDPLDVVFSVAGSGTRSGFIITDDNNNILAVPPGAGPFDLDGAGVGTCLIWAVSYDAGFAGAVVGNNLSALTGCFDLSEPLTVYREAPDGGMVSLLDGGTNFAQCAGQVVFDVTHVNEAQFLSYWYIITDANNNILGWVNSANSNTIDLSEAPAGTCRIWGWSYRGLGDPVIGDPISTLTDDDCEAISDNFITVYREIPDGGTVSLVDGSTSYRGTVGDITFDVTHATTAPFLSYWYIITDDSDNILGWVNSANSNTIDLSDAPAGTCRIWGWNYRGLGDPVIGQSLSTLTDDFCEDISTNFIEVTRQAAGCDVEAGSLALRDGRTSIQLCAADGRPDILRFVPEDIRGDYRLVVTNSADDIIALPTTNTINADGMSAGEYRVYILAYAGASGVEVGNNISQITGCFDLSNPFVLDRVICDDVCQVPLNLRLTKLSSSRYRVTWDRVSNARGYQISLGFEGNSRRFLIPVRGRSVTISTSSSRRVIVAVRSVCSRSTYSDFSNEVYFQGDGRKASRASETTGRQYGEFFIDEPSLSISPNPTSDFINLSYDNGDEESFLQIFDATGRIVRQLTLPGGVINESIPVSDLQNGLYQVTITSNGEILDHSRFIKI